MSKTRWRYAVFAALLLSPFALFGLRGPRNGQPPFSCRVLFEGADTARAFAFSPDGATLAVGTGVSNGSDGVAVLDVATGEPVASFAGHRNHVLGVAFTDDGRTLTSASYEAVKCWTLATGMERAAPFSVTLAYRSELALAPDGRRLALAQETPDGAAQVVELGGAAVRLVRRESPRPPNCLAFDRSGRVLAAAGLYGVQVWDVDANRPRRLLPESSAPLTAVTFAPDGLTLAAGSLEGTVHLWDLTTGASRGEIGIHLGSVNCLAFSPDGRTLASGGDDGTVRLWDVGRGTERAVGRGHTERVNAVAFAPDGRALASAGSDRTVRLWEVDAAD